MPTPRPNYDYLRYWKSTSKQKSWLKRNVMSKNMKDGLS